MSSSLLAAFRSTLRSHLLGLRNAWLRGVWKMDIGRDCKISFTAKLDRTNPQGVHIGDYTGVAFGSAIISHDFLRNQHVDTWIGARCHIGAHVIVYPGVRIGDGCIIAAGSVVTRDIPDGCIASGNPARVIEKDIVTGKWGIRIDALPTDRLDPRVVA